MVSPSRSLRGRIGAYAMHAHNDSRIVTANARAAFMSRFEDEVDPTRILSESERDRRALAARKAYFSRLAYNSAKARAKRKAANEPAPMAATHNVDEKAPAPVKADALEVERASAHTTAS